MKIRLILLSLAGVAVYIVLANFNSKMIKETAVPKDQSPVAAPQKHPGTPPAPAPPTVTTPAAQPEAAVSAPTEPEPAAHKQPEPAPPKTAEPPPVQLTVEPPVVNSGAIQQLREEIARKDQQISQLLDAQEAIAVKYRALLAEAEAGAAGVEATNKILAENAGQIKALTAGKETMAAELRQARVDLNQLQQTMQQVQAAGAEAKDKLAKENTDRIKTLVADSEKTSAELRQAKADLEQLRQQIDQMKAAGLQAEEFLKKKEALLQTVQTQIQERTGESNQLKAQLTETVDKLAAAKAELEQAERKAEVLVRLGAEKEQLANTLNEQKAAVEQALHEKTESLNKAILTIQSLKQEVAAQPQAVATVQHLLDERTKEFDQIKKEAATRIDQLSKQVADLGKSDTQAAKERDRCKAETETARKKVEELEAAHTKAQAALAEAEQKLAAALESKNALQTQLNDKNAALGNVQAQINEQAATAAALRNEKLGLASQLEALQADHNALLTMKNSFEDQAAALAKAEGKLKEMAALQAKIEEMNKTLADKSQALDKAAKQGEELAALQTKVSEASKQVEVSGAAIKQMEAEKSELASQLAALQAQMQQIDSLKKSLDEKSNALTLAEIKIKELTTVSEQAAALESKLTASQTARQAAEKKAGDAEAAAKKCSESLTASTDKVKTLEGNLAAAQTRITELTDKNQLREQQDLVPNLNQQIATLRDQIAQTEAAAAQAKKIAADAATTVQAKAEETQAATKKAQALQAEKEGLQQSLRTSQASIDDLQKQLALAKAFQATIPATPAPAAATNKLAAGGLADADQDGVADSADLCPGSPAGSPVNGLGCPAQKGIVLNGVSFKSGTAVLTPDSLKKLDQVAAALKQGPQLKLEVAGYTDSAGDANRNLTLSAQRAQAVVTHLTGKGVAAARLTAKGFGPDNPVADNATPEGRQKNRRIELHPMAQ